MKKILAIALAVMMLVSLFAFVGCDNGGQSGTKFLVGAIYINSQNDTSGYTYAHHHGISTAMKNLGLSDDQLLIIDNVPEDDTQVTSAIETLVGKGCKIIFGISFGYINAMAAAAENYPDVIFSHGTGYLSNSTNFNNYFGRAYQARYLAGIAAGLKALELGNPNLGYVAAYGTEYAETCSGINGFALGVQSVYPEAVVHVKKINNWADEQKEKDLAQELIDTYNCCVIAQHCDSAQPQIVAAQNGQFGCGYNSDMTADAPNGHLTAPIWNWYVYYQLAIETAMKNPSGFVSTVGNYYGGLKEGFVDVSPLTANCTADTAAKIEAARATILDGSWDVFSGVKLSFADDGSIVKTEADLKTNDGTVIVAAGGASVEDGVITGSMNYYVEGVVEH